MKVFLLLAIALIVTLMCWVFYEPKYGETTVEFIKTNGVRDTATFAGLIPDAELNGNMWTANQHWVMENGIDGDRRATYYCISDWKIITQDKRYLPKRWWGLFLGIALISGFISFIKKLYQDFIKILYHE